METSTLENLELTAEETPNPNTIKFNVNRVLLEHGTLNYITREAAEESLLASRLMELDSVTGVLIGPTFISVTKTPEADWSSLVPVVKTLKAVLNSGEVLVPDKPHEVDEATSRIEQQIRDILDSDIRPAVARDGGDITFYGYEDGVVTLHLQGACSSCPSAIFTLKMGVENRLKSLIPEVQEVVQV